MTRTDPAPHADGPHVDGHRLGTAEESYFTRAAEQRYEQPDRVRRPVSIWLASLAAVALGVLATASFAWPLFTADPQAAAAKPVETTGIEATGMEAVQPGQMLLWGTVIGVGAGLTWLGVAYGVFRGIAWVRVVGLVLLVPTLLALWMSVTGPDRPVQRTVDRAAVAPALLLLATLAWPNRAWWDWRRH